MPEPSPRSTPNPASAKSFPLHHHSSSDSALNEFPGKTISPRTRGPHLQRGQPPRRRGETRAVPFLAREGRDLPWQPIRTPSPIPKITKNRVDGSGTAESVPASKEFVSPGLEI